MRDRDYTDSDSSSDDDDDDDDDDGSMPGLISRIDYDAFSSDEDDDIMSVAYQPPRNRRERNVVDDDSHDDEEPPHLISRIDYNSSKDKTNQTRVMAYDIRTGLRKV